MKKLILIFLAMLSSPSFAQNYQPILNGKRLILDSATCAGIEFAKNGKTALWRNEMECQMNDKESTVWRVKWLNDNNFLMIQTQRPNQESPPIVYSYQILSINGKNVKAKNIWTGWGNLNDDIENFKIK